MGFEKLPDGWSSLNDKFNTVLVRLMWLGAPRATCQHFPNYACQCSSSYIPQELIYLVVMVGYMTVVAKRDCYQNLDFFSGAGRLAKLSAGLGFGTAAVDKEIGAPLDLNTSGGFVWLCRTWLGLVVLARDREPLLGS